MGLPKIQGEVGKLWASPELRYTSGGKAVCTVPIVFNKRKKSPAGVWEDAGSLFVRGNVWEQMAEMVAESLEKGDEVIVSGELVNREYEKQDGTKGYSLELAVWAIGPSLRRFPVKIQRAERSTESAEADPWGGGSDTDAPF